MPNWETIPAGAVLEVALEGDIITDVTDYTLGHDLKLRRGRPHEPSQLQSLLEAQGTSLDLREYAEVRCYVPAVSGPHTRLFHGYCIHPKYTVRSSINWQCVLDCVGDNWLWSHPPMQLEAPLQIGYDFWQPGKTYEVGDVVKPALTNSNGWGHRFECTIAGTSIDDPIGPAWNISSGGFTVDATVQWQEVGAGYVTDAEAINIVLPMFFGTDVTYDGINTLIADVGTFVLLPGMSPDDCMKEIAKYASSGTFTPWANGATIEAGDLIEPSPANGYYYRALDAGTLGISQPVWPTTIGATVSTTGTGNNVTFMNMGPTSVHPFWELLVPEDNSGHTASWKPDAGYYDANSDTQIQTISIQYSDQNVEDATHIHYEDIEVDRNADSYANRMYVFGESNSFAIVNDTVGQGYVGRIVSDVLVLTGDGAPRTEAECEAVGNHALALRRTRETVTVAADQPLDLYLQMISPAKGAVSNDLLALDEEVYPIVGSDLDLASGKWKTQFGDGFLTEHHDPLDVLLGGRRFVQDITAPDPARWETNPSDPNYFLLENVVDPTGRSARIQVQWLSSGEADLHHANVLMEVVGQTPYVPLGNVNYPRQNITVPAVPSGTQVRFHVLTVDSQGNYPRHADQTPAYAISPTVTAASIPDPPVAPTITSITSGRNPDGTFFARVNITHAGDHSNGGHIEYHRGSGPSYRVPIARNRPTPNFTVTVPNLTTGTYSFAADVIDQFGQESDLSSPEVNHTINVAPRRNPEPIGWEAENSDDPQRGMETVAGADGDLTFTTSIAPFSGKTSALITEGAGGNSAFRHYMIAIPEGADVVLRGARKHISGAGGKPNAALKYQRYDETNATVGSEGTVFDAQPTSSWVAGKSRISWQAGTKYIRALVQSYDAGGQSGTHVVAFSEPTYDFQIVAEQIPSTLTLTDQIIELTSTSKIKGGGGKVEFGPAGLKVTPDTGAPGTNNIDFYNEANQRIGSLSSSGASGSGDISLNADYDGAGSTTASVSATDIVNLSAGGTGFTVDSSGAAASNLLQADEFKFGKVNSATLTDHLHATATLDFPSTGSGVSSDLTITVTGAALGDTVALGVPHGSVLANTCYTAWVSATNTVTVRFNNYSSLGAQNPASGTFGVDVWKH